MPTASPITWCRISAASRWRSSWLKSNASRARPAEEGGTMSPIAYRPPNGLDVTKLQPAVGALVEGIDLAGEISPAAARDIRNALLAHGVIFFRNQKLSYES